MTTVAERAATNRRIITRFGKPLHELDADQHADIEHLAARCPHAATPCQRCTDLAVWAVTALDDTGWHEQIRHYQNARIGRSAGSSFGGVRVRWWGAPRGCGRCGWR